MKATPRTLLGGALLALAATPAQAQEATFNNPSLVPELAVKAARAAVTACRDQDTQVTAAVVDGGGNTQALMRDRYAGPHTVRTAITKAQIRSMLKKGVFQLGLFDEPLCEVEHGGARYILRRNPFRAEEMAQNRADRLATLRKLAEDRNAYLADHPRANPHKAWQKVSEKAGRLQLSAFVTVTAEDRLIGVEVDEDALTGMAELDGCYALKTDLPAEAAPARTIHDRYKDLALVEQGFRTMKTMLLEVRPVFVRRAASTRAHVLVVMLAYLVARRLGKAGAHLNLTVEEGLDHLKSLGAVEVGKKGGASALRIPEPAAMSSKLLSALKTKLPAVLPKSSLRVGTRKSIAKAN